MGVENKGERKKERMDQQFAEVLEGLLMRDSIVFEYKILLC